MTLAIILYVVGVVQFYFFFYMECPKPWAYNLLLSLTWPLHIPLALVWIMIHLSINHAKHSKKDER